jgi:hypothetical protein
MCTFKSATLDYLYWIPKTSVSIPIHPVLSEYAPDNQAGVRFKYSLPQAPLPPPLPARDVEPLPSALIAVVLAWGAKFSGKFLVERLYDKELNCCFPVP